MVIPRRIHFNMIAANQLNYSKFSVEKEEGEEEEVKLQLLLWLYLMLDLSFLLKGKEREELQVTLQFHCQ